MKSSRKRNVARKARSIRPRAAAKSAPPHPDPCTGQPEFPTGQTDSPIPQPEAAGFVSQNAPPDAAHREPEAENGFVSQNRANAQHSTGPRTPEGKAASSQNAFKHGLSIQRHAVLRGEDPALYAQLLAELREIYEPRSRREDLAVEDIAQCRWALARFDEAEAVCLQKLTDYSNDPVAFEGEDPINTAESLGHAATVLTDFDDKDRRYVEPDTHYPAFDKIHRYRTYWERKHTRALTEFDRAQRARRADAAELRAEAARLRAEEQARHQAEAHALKQELALARELRQRELHELRLEQAREKLRHQPPTQPGSARFELSRSEPPESESPEESALRALEAILNTPASVAEEDFLRSKLSQDQNGFVSQNAELPQDEAVFTSPTPASCLVASDQ